MGINAKAVLPPVQDKKISMRITTKLFYLIHNQGTF